MSNETNAFSLFEPLYLLERHRKESFEEWAYDENSSCSINKMAEAGFYWCGDKWEDDTVKCFVCGKTLTGWDPGDNPWEEHMKHAPQCPFIKYHRKEGDLTLDEFLCIFSAVVKKQILHEFNTIKDEFELNTSTDLDKFYPGKL